MRALQCLDGGSVAPLEDECCAPHEEHLRDRRVGVGGMRPEKGIDDRTRGRTVPAMQGEFGPHPLQTSLGRAPERRRSYRKHLLGACGVVTLDACERKVRARVA